MKKINEIFYSIQGEGRHSGTPAIFIRFSGCNLKCPFCDTVHQNGVMMSDDEIITIVKNYPSNLVVLTGGEPTLFIDKAFINALHEIGKYVTIETNGTNEVLDKVDFVTCSPKFEYCKNAELKVKRINELKVVFDGQNDMGRYDGIKADFYYLQPCDTGDKQKNEEIIQEVMEYCLAHPKWRISLQTQKILKVR